MGSSTMCYLQSIDFIMKPILLRQVKFSFSEKASKLCTIFPCFSNIFSLFLTAGNVSERSKELVFSAIFSAISIFVALFVIGHSLDSHWTVSQLFAYNMPAVIEQIYFCSCFFHNVLFAIHRFYNETKFAASGTQVVGNYVLRFEISNIIEKPHTLVFFTNINPIPTSLCHVITVNGLIQPMACRNRVKYVICVFLPFSFQI
jgi:hypothetical protein